MHADIRPAIDALLADRPLTTAEAEAAFTVVMSGDASDVETASLLTALALRGETPEALAGAAAVLRRHATTIAPRATGLLDTCGTGGDRLHTFNISTATALVVAGCGVPVAKHGNRSVSSSSGSADVLEAMGVILDRTPEEVADAVDTHGLGFLYARQLHPAMRHVAAVRATLGFRTAFNLLGPLANPASATFHLLGVGDLATARVVADAVALLSVPANGRTVVVCGNNQIDEVALWGTTSWFAVGGDGLREAGTWTPNDFGLEAVDVDDLKVASPQESADVIRGVLAGDDGPATAMVLANAAAALWCCGRVPDVRTGVNTARDAVRDGNAAAVLQDLSTAGSGEHG